MGRRVSRALVGTLAAARGEWKPLEVRAMEGRAPACDFGRPLGLPS